MNNFPFDHVIITFPDAAAARTAELGPIQSLRATTTTAQQQQGGSSTSSIYDNVRFTATADPYDARVGSGGGTAAALYDHSSNTTVSNTKLQETVLILHAGGAASRCPTQMCLGKAWTSLPTFGKITSQQPIEEHGYAATIAATTTTTRPLHTPLHVWLDICHRMFGGDVTRTAQQQPPPRSLPQGSVVVVASDTLLQLEDGGDGNGGINNFGRMDWYAELDSKNTILGLAVPAPLSTAKNHGVFVTTHHHSSGITNIDNNHNNDSVLSNMRVAPCRTVLQKPTVHRMESTTNCCFTNPVRSMSDVTTDNDTEGNLKEELCAWIDTGVTIFSPSAANQLYNFTKQHLQRCTATGLKTLYHEQLEDRNNNNKNNSRNTNSDVGYQPSTYDLVTFASKNAMSIDLYTHILQSLALFNETVQEQQERKEKFLQTYATELPTEILDAIINTFASCVLQILVVPFGRFWHLGTTVELHNFLIDACSLTRPNVPTIPCNDLCRTFGSQLGLTRRLRAYTTLGGNIDGGSCVDPTAVIYDSIVSVQHKDAFPNNAQSYIGSRTVIEHCNIAINDGCIHIGNNCLVSGLRMLPNPTQSSSLFIPDNFIIQMVQLSTNVSCDNTTQPAVIIALSMSDDIKKSNLMYGVPVELFLSQYGLDGSDVWGTSDSSQTIWTAKIHPIISLSNQKSFASVFSWLEHLDVLNDRNNDTLKDNESFKRWKNSQRLSLSEIRDVSDAPHEFLFRNELITKTIPQFRSQYIDSIRTMLYERQHAAPIDFQFLIDGYISTNAADQLSTQTSVRDILDVLHAMDDVVREHLHRNGSRDICARAAMLLGGLLDDIAKTSPLPDLADFPEDITDRLLLHSRSFREYFDRPETLMNATLDAYNNLVSMRDGFVEEAQLQGLAKVATVMEDLASILTGLHIRAASGMQKSIQCQTPIYDRWVVATAPVRVDLSGGWSDTPPICYEFGSLVTGMAVTIDHKKPLACRCRVITGGTGILLRTEQRSIKNGEILSELQIEITSFDMFHNYRDPTADCALLKCVLIQLGFVPVVNDNRMNEDFQSILNRFCCSDTTSVRLEVVTTSVLPHGSGLGTSSILAGCILASVGMCIGTGNVSSSDEYVYEIIDSVLNVEQHLSTGGGFQDQVNGLVGGMKVVSSVPQVHPMKISIEKLVISSQFQKELDDNMFLVYTGTTRLAKNLLKQVLYRWSKHTPEIMEAVNGLVKGAANCRDAIAESDMNGVGICLSDYWTYKKIMAGPLSGVEPPIVTNVIRRLNDKHLLRGASLCGAGGGGFMVLMTKPGVSILDLQSALCHSSTEHWYDPTTTTTTTTTTTITDNVDDDPRASVDKFTWHTCQVCMEGLSINVCDDIHDVDYFSIDWLSTKNHL